MKWRQRERSVIEAGDQYGEENTRKDTGIAISKIANISKVFKFCLLNVCKREYGIKIVSQLVTVRIKGGGFELRV
jgi:hypothetical protein